MATTQTQQAIVLTYNKEVEHTITQNGGTIVYSKDNIVIGSEISEELYRELLKNTYIESVFILPLKRYTSQDTQTSEQSNQQGGYKQVNTQTQVYPQEPVLKQGNQPSNTGGS
jgi:hypothetical protein